jgi:hypothetical protein
MSSAFVLDCSATLPWIFSDEATDATDRLLNELTLGGARVGSFFVASGARKCTGGSATPESA